MSGNTYGRLQGRVRLHICQDCRVWNRFDQARAKERRRDSENNVWIPTLARERISRRQEVGLGDVATGGVTSPGNHEEVAHFAVGDSVALLEPRFADRTILCDEPGLRV